MTKRFSHFDTREIGRRRWMLLANFTYYDSVYGPITAHKGFETNYASLDGLRNIITFPIYAMLVDYGDKSATIHDFIYNRGGFYDQRGEFVPVSRYEADQIFYRALRAEGVARWRAGLFLGGVRVFGRKYYLPKTR
ncbi:hypothetical protein D9M69_259130 [compost metagenome]